MQLQVTSEPPATLVFLFFAGLWRQGGHCKRRGVGVGVGAVLAGLSRNKDGHLSPQVLDVAAKVGMNIIGVVWRHLTEHALPLRQHLVTTVVGVCMAHDVSTSKLLVAKTTAVR